MSKATKVVLGLGVILTVQTWVQAADTYVAPQAELFVTHNRYFMSHFVASGNWLASEGAFSSAWAQYDLDIGLVPFFRRYVFKDPNPEKSKRISFRVGYLQVSDLKSDPNGFDEKRPLIDVIYRQPIGRAWLIDDRNRAEYRLFNDDDFARYRNRIRLEHNAVLGKLRVTPYATGEFFYTGKDRWNEFQTAPGY